VTRFSNRPTPTTGQALSASHRVPNEYCGSGRKHFQTFEPNRAISYGARIRGQLLEVIGGEDGTRTRDPGVTERNKQLIHQTVFWKFNDLLYRVLLTTALLYRSRWRKFGGAEYQEKAVTTD
jgi:hypothetical protein